MRSIDNASSKKLMLVTSKVDVSLFGGRSLLCKLISDSLSDIFQKQVTTVELPRAKMKGLRQLILAIKGHIDGLSGEIIRAAIQTAKIERVEKIFVDGSNLGEFARVSKNTYPSIEIITFFHNVEARFFLGSFRQKTSVRAFLVLLVNYLAERKAVHYSDKIICLSDRDSRLLYKIYGRGATHISPIALHDKQLASTNGSGDGQREKFALFVGSAFYANLAGIRWFVRYVVPHINIKICVVGRGLECLKSELEWKGKVEVVGAVDDLASWYRDSLFVVAPIFDGSGMKTKVAEALMFGKKIVGTAEAFSGYETIADRSGWVCETVTEFVAAIGEANDCIVKSCDPELRGLFLETYSYPAARARLEKILASVNIS